MTKRLTSLLLALILAFTLVPSALADSSDCGISACTCSGSCSYGTSNYSSSNSTQHTYNIYCRGCGVGGGLVLVESHSFSGNRCTKCGYTKSTGGGGGEEPEEPDVPDFCYHRDTSTRWDGCYWYEYCNDCGSLVDMGESHGATVYDGWEYYNRTQHRRYAYCADCGEGEYEYDRHSTREQYEQYSAGQHRVTDYCDVCGHTVGYSSYEGHSLAYGAWGAYNDAQHRRAHYCRYCGYTTYDYAGHSFSYSAWQDYDESRHRRTESCAACGLSNYDYAGHADSNGDGKCDGCAKELTVYVDVTLDACGGVLADDSVTVIFGNTYGELPEPTREGYTFDGWYTEKDGGELVEAGTEVSDKTTHTLYAHWTLTKVFSVTVPAGLPLAVTEDGVVTSSTDAAISNNSTCDVRVTGISLRTENGWTLVPFTYNMAAAKVDSKLIGFAIGGAQSVNGGESEALALTGDWSIDAGATLPLDYDANVSATSVSINKYFLQHPEMVLGAPTADSTQYAGQDYTVAPIEGADLAAQLHEAIRHIHGEYTEREVEETQSADILPADPDMRNYSFTLVDGEVFYREGGIMVRQDVSAAMTERIRGMMELRDCTRRLIELQTIDAGDGVIAAEQKRLNELYDAFTAKYGLISSRENKRAFEDDSSYYLLCSLEILDDDGNLERKSDMFTKRTIGKASAVFVKDLSRLGRNYIEVGRLTEEFFPEHDIRLVSVSDGIDTDEGENELAPIRNLFNEWYARDISKKSRISNKIRGNAGVPIGQPPYGYVKNPDGSKRWVIDPEAASVVRRIYMLTLDGQGSEQIADTLTKEQVLTPRFYWEAHGVKRPGKPSSHDEYRWNSSTIVGILSRQEYCGDLVNFKTYSKSYKNKKRLTNAPENRAVFRDVHEAIIPREVWERVQQKRTGIRKRQTNSGERNMFSGLLVCADCGRNMHYHFNYTNPEITYFSCPNTKSERGTCTGTHYIRVDFLEQVVLGEIRRLTKFVSQYETQFAKLMMGFMQQAMATERKQVQLELSKAKARDRELDTLFEKLYEDNVAGKISDERFVRMSKKYELEQEELSSSIKALQADIERIDGKAATADMFISAVRKYTRARKLTPRMLNELIDKIEVHQAEKVDGVWRQRLTIHYNCVGAITLPDTATIQAPHVTMNTRQGVYVTYEPYTPSPAADTASA